MMNCPNCNKEVSPEWELCPFCGFEPKKCSNTKHAPRWLPQEAKFCPDCGKTLEETVLDNVIISSMPYVSTNETELISIKHRYPLCNTFRLPSEIPIRLKYGQFPIKDNLSPKECNIILGWTSVLEAATYANGDINMKYLPSTLVCVNSCHYWDHDHDGIIESAYLTKYDPVPSEWKRAGMSFSKSYNDWLSWFSENGFIVEISEKPYVDESSEYRGSLCAELYAYNESTGIKIELVFRYSGKPSIEDTNTLYCISVSRNMSTLEKLL